MQREEQEAAEWRRRVDDCAREAKEEADRQHVLLTQTKEKLNDDWTLELRSKEVGLGFYCRTGTAIVLFSLYQSFCIQSRVFTCGLGSDCMA